MDRELELRTRLFELNHDITATDAGDRDTLDRLVTEANTLRRELRILLEERGATLDLEGPIDLTSDVE